MRTLALLIVTIPIIAANQPRKWEVGVLEEEHRDPDRRNVEYYTVDAGDTIIVCSQLLAGFIKPGQAIAVPVGHVVKFARISGSQLVLLDIAGKEHKVTIEQERQR